MSSVTDVTQSKWIEELALNPDDGALLDRIEECVAESGDFALFRQAAATLVDRRGGPGARSLALRLSATLVRLAEAAKRPRDGMELYVRAARLQGDANDAPDKSAESLAAAWRLLPDHRIVERAWNALGQPNASEMPEHLLIARSQLGGDGAVKATLQLADRRLNQGRLGEAHELYLELKKVRPNDRSIDHALIRIEQLKKGRSARVKSAESAVKRAGKSGVAAVKAWTSFGIGLLEMGESAEGEAALRTACAAGDAPEGEARLERLLRDQGRLEELARFLRVQMERAATDKKRARQSRLVELRRRLYRLLKDELRRPQEAKNVMNYTRAVQQNDASSTLKEARRIGRRGNWKQACELLETAADRASSGGVRQAMMLEVARILDLEMKDDAKALEAYKVIRASDPDSIDMLQFFRRLHRQKREKKRAFANLKHLHDVLIGASHRTERISVAVEMARLARNALSDKDYGIEAWKRVLADEPHHQEAHRELRRLYEDGHRWHAEVELLNNRLEFLKEDQLDDKISTLFEIIDVYQDPDKLGMEEMVIATYRRLVELSPSNQRALESLSRKYRDSEKWANLVQVLRQRLEHTNDPDELVALFGEIASLYMEQIESDAQAIPVLERLLELDPGNLEIVQRMRSAFARRHSTWRLYQTYQKELDLLAGSERAQILVELARIATEELFRYDEAVDWWKKLLDVSPNDPRALSALEQLHSEQKDWPGYVALLEKKLEGSYTRKQRVEILLELGEVAYSRLGDEEKARRIFLRICDLSPFNTRARRYLQRIYVTRRAWKKLLELYAPRGDWDGYLRLLEEFTEEIADPDLMADIHVERARVLSEVLGDMPKAVFALERALMADGDRMDVATRLLDQYDDSAPAERRMAAHECVARNSTKIAQREHSWRALAQLRKDESGLLEAWSEALLAGAASGNIEGLGELERSLVATGAWEAGAETLSTVLSQLPMQEVAARLKIHRSIAQIARERLQDPGRAITHYKCLLMEAPGDLEALEALEELYLSQHNFVGLEEVLRKRSESCPDLPSRQEALGRLGQLYEDVFGNLERAAEIYETVLRADPHDETTLAKLRRSYVTLEKWHELTRALEQVLAVTPGHAPIIELHLELADIYRHRLGDLRTAIEHYRSALEVPGVPRQKVVSALEDLLVYPDVEERLLPILEHTYRAMDQPKELLALLERKVTRTHAHEEQLPIYDEIAFLAQHVSGDLDLAFRTQMERFRIDPGQRSTWGELELLAGQVNSWDILAALWRDALSGGGVNSPRAIKGLDKRGDRNALRLALARVLTENAGDLEERIELYEAVLRESQDPRKHPELYDRLEDLYHARPDLRAVADVLMRGSQVAMSATVEREKLLQAAEIYAGDLEDVEAATRIYEDLLERLPWDERTVHALASLYEVSQRHGPLAELLDRAASEASDEEVRDTLTCRLAQVQHEGLNDRGAAIETLVSLLASDWVAHDAIEMLLEFLKVPAIKAKDRNRIIEELTRHFDAIGDNSRKAEIHLLRLASSRSSSKRSRIYVEAGDLLSDGWADDSPPSVEGATRAYELFASGFEEDVHNDEASLAMQRTARWARKLENCANRIARAAENAPEHHLKALRWLDLAAFATDQLDDPALAIEAWNRVIGLDRLDPETLDHAFDGLIDAYASLGADENRLRVLRLKRDRSEHPLKVFTLWVQEASILQGLGLGDDVVSALESALSCAEGANDGPWGAARDAFSEEAAAVATDLGRGPKGIDFLRRLAHVEAEESPEQAKRRLHQGAALAENVLDAAEVAIDLLFDARRLDTSDKEAAENLERLLGETSRFEEKVVLLEELAQVAYAEFQPETGAARLMVVGELLRVQLDDPVAALATYAKVLEHDPDYYPALDAVRFCIDTELQAATGRFMLADAFKRSGDDSRRIDILEEILESEELKVDEDVSQVYFDLATARLSRGEAPVEVWRYAEAAYRTHPFGEAGIQRRTVLVELNDLSDDSLPLGRVLLEAATGIHNVEHRLMRRRMDIALFQQTASDPTQLVPFWKAVLVDDPDDEATLDLLEQHARESGNADELRAVLGAKASRASTLGERIEHLRELAELLMTHLRHEEAVGIYEQILQEDPGQRAAFESLADLYETLQMPEYLVEVLETQILHTQDRSRKRMLQKWLARTWWLDLDDLDRAVSVYNQLGVSRTSSVDPDVVDALEAMWDTAPQTEGLFELLEPIHLQGNDGAALSGLYRRAAGLEGELDFRRACLQKLFDLQNEGLATPRDAFDTLLLLIESDDYVPARLEKAEAMAGELDTWQQLLAFYGRLVESGWGEVDFITHVGSLWDEKLGDVSQAIHSYERALEQDSLHTLSRERLSQVLTRQERWADLSALLSKSAEATLDQDDKVRIWWEQEDLLETKLHDVSGAIEALNRILELDPAHEAANQRKELLLRGSSPSEDLHRHYREWSDRIPTSDISHQIKTRLALSLLDEPQSLAEGLRELGDVLAANHDLAEAHEALVSVIERAERVESNLGKMPDVWASALEGAVTLLEKHTGADPTPTQQEAIWRVQIRKEGPGGKRRTLLGKLGRLLIQQRKFDGALTCFGDLARSHPSERSLPKVLGELGDLGADPTKLAQVYEDCLQGELKPALRQRLMTDLAAHLRLRLQRPLDACAWYEQIIDADPTNRAILDTLAATYHDLLDHSAEEKTLSRLIDVAKNRSESVRLSRRLGDLRVDHLGARREAAQAYEDCLPEALVDPSFRARLESLYAQERDFGALSDVYQRALNESLDTDARIELLAKSAQVLETQLADLDGAAGRCRELLDLRPDHRFGLKSLARIERRRENWDELYTVLGTLEAMATEPSEKARLLSSRASLAARYLGKASEALDILTMLQEIDPTMAVDATAIATLHDALKDTETRSEAARRLEPMLETIGDWEGLLGALRVILETRQDPEAQVTAAIRMAQIAEVKLNDPLRAIQMAGDVLVEYAPHASAAVIPPYLTALGERTECWSALTLCAERAASAGHASERELDLLVWLAQVQERAGFDASIRTATYEQLLNLDGENETFLSRLEELYRQTGRWNDLRDLITRKLGNVEGDDRVNLLVEMAESYEAQNDLRAAVTLMVELLQQAPRQPQAIATLERGLESAQTAGQAAAALEELAREDSDWLRVIDLEEIQFHALTDPQPRARLLCEMAEVFEKHLQNMTRAFECFGRALDFDDEKLHILGRMEALAAQRDLYPELAKTLSHVGRGTEEPALRVELLLRLAQILELQMDDQAGAREAIREVQSLAPEHPHALRSMVRLARGTDDLDELETCTRDLLEVTKGTDERIELLGDLYEIARRRDDQEAMEAACHRVLKEQRGEQRAVGRLLQLLLADDRLDAYEELLLQEGRATTDGKDRAKIDFWLGEHHERAGSMVLALQAFETSWTLDSGSIETAEALVRRYQEAGHWRRLYATLSRQIELLDSDEEASETLLALGEVASLRLDNVSEAVDAFERVLDVDGGNVRAMDALVELYPRQGRVRRFLDICHRRAEAEEDSVARNTLLIRACRAALGDPGLDERVDETLRLILRDDPVHAQANVMAAKKSMASDTLSPDIGSRLKKALPDALGDDRVEILLTLSELSIAHLDDAKGALAFVLEARELAPHHPDLAPLLRAAFEKTGSYRDLCEILESEFNEAQSPPERCDRALELARTFWKEIGDEASFSHWITKAREIRRDSVEAAEMLVAFHTERHNVHAVLPTLEWLVNYYDAKKLTSDLAHLAHKLARLLEEDGAEEKALDYYRMSLHADGTYIPNLLDYGRLLTRRERWVRSLKVHQSLLMQRHKLEAVEDREDVLYHLAIASFEMSENARANQHLSRLLEENPDHAKGKKLRLKHRS